MAEQSEVAIEEPAQQGRALSFRKRIGIFSQHDLQLQPVGNGGSNIFEVRAQRFDKFPADTGIGSFKLDIDYRLAFVSARRLFGNFYQLAFCISPDRDNRVDQPLHGQAETGNSGANRVDQKGHVVVNYRKTQMPVILVAADTFKRQARFAALPFVSASQGEPRRFFASLFVKTDILARQRAFAKGFYQRSFETVGFFARSRGFWFEIRCHFSPEWIKTSYNPVSMAMLCAQYPTRSRG